MERMIEPEWLDELPADDARAVASRRDLQRLNRIMGHGRIMAGLFLQAGGGGRDCHVVELGAGDGTFAAGVIERLPANARPGRVTLVDRVALVDAETRRRLAAYGCAVDVAQADVFAWLASAPPVTVVAANLFLHHFSDGELKRLLRLIAERARAFIACEPRRFAANLVASRLVGLIGCNAVTRHDAVASVRAGFADGELSRLWPEDSQWSRSEGKAGWFSHVFAARREWNGSEGMVGVPAEVSSVRGSPDKMSRSRHFIRSGFVRPTIALDFLP
jgi:hypothetical protein